jgi:hypothetical protein
MHAANWLRGLKVGCWSTRPGRPSRARQETQSRCLANAVAGLQYHRRPLLSPSKPRLLNTLLPLELSHLPEHRHATVDPPAQAVAGHWRTQRAPRARHPASRRLRRPQSGRRPTTLWQGSWKPGTPPVKSGRRQPPISVAGEVQATRGRIAKIQKAPGCFV